MKKGMIILGECIVFLIVINIFRIGLVNIFQDLENNRIFSYILYFVLFIIYNTVCNSV